jgi:hypothetical protein
MRMFYDASNHMQGSSWILVFKSSLCREVEDTILLALQSPDIYDDIDRGTRRNFESNRPVLFEDPTGLFSFSDLSKNY